MSDRTTNSERLTDYTRQTYEGEMINLIRRSKFEALSRFPIERENYPEFYRSLLPAELRSAMAFCEAELGNAGVRYGRMDRDSRYSLEGFTVPDEQDADYTGGLMLTANENYFQGAGVRNIPETHPYHPEILAWYKAVRPTLIEVDEACRLVNWFMYQLSTTGQIMRLFPEAAEHIMGKDTVARILSAQKRASSLPWDIANSDDLQRRVATVNKLITTGLLLGPQKSIHWVELGTWKAK